MNKVILVSFRQVVGHFSKYLFLFIVIAFGFSVITIMTSYSDSMRLAIMKSAENHYGGQFFILGVDGSHNNFLLTEDNQTLEAYIDETDFFEESIYKRTNYMYNGYIYFNGNSVRQKNIYGVDFDTEITDFRILDFHLGYIPTREKGILVSKITSEKLQCNINDLVTIKVSTKTGQVNTGEFYIDGIVDDSSLFGAYRIFMDRRELNKLLNIKEESYSSMGLFLGKNSDYSIFLNDFNNKFSDKLSLSGEINSKTMLTRELNKKWKGIKYFVFPLSVYISEVSSLITAMEIISYILYIMISLIMIVSVYVSFNVIIKKRTVELASMRSLGMQKNELRRLIVFESVFLLLISIILGAFISIITFFIVSKLSFSSLPGFSIFLIKGKLLPVITFRRLIFNLMLLFIAVIPSSWIPANKLANRKIAELLIGKEI